MMVKFCYFKGLGYAIYFDACIFMQFSFINTSIHRLNFANFSFGDVMVKID